MTEQVIDKVSDKAPEERQEPVAPGDQGCNAAGGANAIDLGADYFELFSLKRAFDVDQGKVSRRYRELQGLLHPDRHATESAAQRRWSMQASSFVNDAHDTLRRPLRRAVYLLSLAGVSTDEETDTQMDPMFLMEQMELREAIESAHSSDDPHAVLLDVRGQLSKAMKAEQASFGQSSDSADWGVARDVVRRWQFLDKLGREISSLEAHLDGDAP